MTTPVEIATAFSRHDFSATFEHLADDVDWDNVGGERHRGRDAVVAACTASAEALADVRTTFIRFRAVDAGATVVIDSRADYHETDGVSTVASCDLYDFAAGRLTAIRSYAVELSPSGDDDR